MGQIYYKVGQVLQSGAKLLQSWAALPYCKVGQSYYKVGQVLQSGAKLLQSGAGITKWGNYYKVGHNIKYEGRICRIHKSSIKIPLEI